MRHTFALSIAIAATTALAEDLLNVLDASELDHYRRMEARELESERLESAYCYERSTDMNDRCYFKSNHYQAKDKETKMEELWSKIRPDENAEDDDVTPFMWKEFPEFFSDVAVEAFCGVSDALRWNRNKTTHTQGLVAKVEWIPVEGNGFSGIYETGSDHVIMRLSERNYLHKHSKGLSPSAAFKFLTDGDQSLNVFAMSSFFENESWNFFEKPIGNRVSPITEEDHPIEYNTMFQKMLEANVHPFALRIGHLGEQYTNGENVNQVKIPYEIQFTSKIANEFDSKKELNSDGDQIMWYDQLKDAHVQGDIIYEVHALTAPSHLGGELVKIADIKLLTELHTSQWADQNLYFRHKGLYWDFKHWEQSWINHERSWNYERMNRQNNSVKEGWPIHDDEDAKAMYEDQVANHGCPFAWLL